MTYRLPRLPRNVRIADKDGTPTVEFQRWFQSLVGSVETAVNSLEDTIAATAAAQSAATSAETAAATANAATATITTEQNIINSYVTGATVTGTDAGSDATINISAHTRVYGGGSSVNVNSGSVTGLAYSTRYFVYYDDAARAGGTVTYLATTSEATAVQIGNRHVVGSVTTPAALASNTTGYYVYPPGSRDISTL